VGFYKLQLGALKAVFFGPLLVAGLLGLACASGSAARGVPDASEDQALTGSSPPAQNDTQAASAASIEVVSQTGAPAPAAVSRRSKLVILDPGHGGDEVGAAANGVVEKDANLDMAFRVEKLLQDQGFEVLLTRREDKRAAPRIAGYTAARSDIQARIDMANAAGADVFVSLHGNGSTDPGQRGVEVWYDSSRPFADENRRLADLLRNHVIGALRSWGYPAQDRGLLDGACFRFRNGRCFSLFVLGGPRLTGRTEIQDRGGNPEALGFNGAQTIYSSAPQMPGALVELLILTNAADAAILRTPSARDAMARGISDAVVEFLGGSAAQ
jgi:N-acetylmuramoyl-L-alanine amidase